MVRKALVVEIGTTPLLVACALLLLELFPRVGFPHSDWARGDLYPFGLPKLPNACRIHSQELDREQFPLAWYKHEETFY